MARRAGLGRGLDALLGETKAEVRGAQDEDADGARRLIDLPVADVHPNPDQPRHSFDEGELEELAASVREHGVLQPIVVRPHEGAYQIVAGERRYQAAVRAGLASVPVVVRDVSDDEVLQLALVENLQRSDLNPMEAALGYRALVEDNGMTHADVARVLGKSRSAITNALRLLELPVEVQGLLAERKLTAGHARAILAADGSEARVALARKVVDDGLSVRQTETLAPLFSVKMREEAPRRAPVPATYRSAARALRKALDTKVRVRTVRGKNKIEIEFGDEADLEGLVARLCGR